MCSFSDILGLIVCIIYFCNYLHDKNTAKTKIYVLTFLLFSKEHFYEKKIKKTDLIMLTNRKWVGPQCILGTTEIAPIKSK